MLQSNQMNFRIDLLDGNVAGNRDVVVYDRGGIQNGPWVFQVKNCRLRRVQVDNNDLLNKAPGQCRSVPESV